MKVKKIRTVDGEMVERWVAENEQEQEQLYQMFDDGEAQEPYSFGDDFDAAQQVALQLKNKGIT